MDGEITFGGWLKQRRKELGITQEEFADNIDCSLATLQKIEGGVRRPSGQIAHLLANLLKIPSDEREAFIVFARAGRTTPIASQKGSDAIVMRAPWRAISSYYTNLPVVLTPLIGRKREEEEAHKELLKPQTRLLSFTGAPGVGKTRLALQVASASREHFEDGAFFVDLAAIVDPDLVLPTVARTLGLKDAGDLPAESALLDYVRERRMLLILDNFEQVLDAASALVRLMEASPWMKVLVTSREALHVRGERRLSVLPLAVPDPQVYKEKESGTTTDRSLSLTTLAAYPSVELFIERAQAVSSEFELTQENARDVAAICTALEGLPLAIELTAARADHFSSSEMRLALGSRHNFHSRAGRDIPARQRTLKSALEWSYRLLDMPEQKLFRRLSVFVHGCTLEAAESVCDATGDLGTSVSQALMSLVDKNLVVRSHREGASRYTMLETIREYALDELKANGEEEHIRKRHADYLRSLVELAGMGISGPDQAIWLDRIEADHDNVRAAIGWLLEYGRGDVEVTLLALHLGSPLYTFWNTRGYFSEGRQWMDSLLSNAELISYEHRSAEFKTIQANVFSAAGLLAWNQGESEKARPFIEASLGLRRELNLKEGIASSLNNLGLLAMEKGDYEEARAFYEQSLAMVKEDNVRSKVALFLNNLGVCHWEMGEAATAAHYYEAALAQYREIGDKAGMIMPLDNLGMVATQLADYALAHRYQDECLALCYELGHKNSLAHVLVNMGQTNVEEGNYAKALHLFAESLPILKQLGYKGVIANCLEGLAMVHAEQGEFKSAVRLWGAASAIRETIGKIPSINARALHESRIAIARARVGAVDFETAWSEGRAASVDEGVRYAQEVLSPLRY